MMKKIDAILVGLCLFFTLTLVLRLFVFPKTYDGKAENRVFLNPKYLPDLNEIIIESGDDKITLWKKDDLYVVSSSDGEIFADRDMVFRLLQAFSPEKTLFHVDDEDGEKYGIVGENSTKVIFKAANSEILSVTFGNLDSILEQIYFTIPGRKGIYKTDDDFSQFFFQRITFWADCDLIPRHKKFEINEVKTLTVDYPGEKSKTIENNDEFIKKLLSSRGGNVVPKDSLGTEKVRVGIVLTSNIEITLKFIPHNNGYAVVFHEEGSGFSPESALEISEYTFNRIFN